MRESLATAYRRMLPKLDGSFRRAPRPRLVAISRSRRAGQLPGRNAGREQSRSSGSHAVAEENLTLKVICFKLVIW